MLYIINLLSLFVSLSFCTLEATESYSNGKGLSIDTCENSLNFSKKYPDLERIFFDWSGENKEMLEYFYLNQTTDLGLSKNKNLKFILLGGNTNLWQFLQKSYLPQVKLLHVYPSCDSWDFFVAFPNLREILSYSRVSLPHLAHYTPHLEGLYIFTEIFDFTEEELNAIAQLKELKKLYYHFHVKDRLSDKRIQEIEQKMQALFPHIEIKIKPYGYQEYYGGGWDLCA